MYETIGDYYLLEISHVNRSYVAHYINNNSSCMELAKTSLLQVTSCTSVQGEVSDMLLFP